jgi:hypothetical protein
LKLTFLIMEVVDVAVDDPYLGGVMWSRTRWSTIWWHTMQQCSLGVAANSVLLDGDVAQD